MVERANDRPPYPGLGSVKISQESPSNYGVFMHPQVFLCVSRTSALGCECFYIQAYLIRSLKS